MRIFVDENIPQGPEVFSAYGEVRVFAGRSLRREDLLQADALLVRSVTRVQESLLRDTPVRFVGTATIGVDHIDREYLAQSGIGFSAAPGSNSRSVAEYVVAALLHLHVELGLPIEGQTLGIVGYGHVGRQVAKVAKVLGLRVLLCDPPLAETRSDLALLSLSELVRQSDILTFHTPLSGDGPYPTRKMLNRDFFSGFNGPKTIMNTSRGEIVDESALLHAFQKGRVRHLVLDVFPGEPKVNPALADAADLISPHIAGYSVQGKLNGTTQILAAFCRHFGFPQKTLVKIPPPQNAVLQLARLSRSTENNLHRIVTDAYSIARDDAELRRTLTHPDAGRAFDNLRRRYPERHEFSSFTVAGIPPAEKALRIRLSELDFSLE